MLEQTYAQIEKAILYLDTHHREQPSLEELARAVNLSPYHFQRLFRRWAGISPKRFLQVLTLAHAKRLLEENESLLDTSLDTGLSGPSRLHDLFVTHEALSPGQFKVRGEGLTLRWGVQDSPFGACLAATTERGICWLSFLESEQEALAPSLLQEQWPRARLQHEPAAVRGPVAAAFAPYGKGRAARTASLAVHLQGTNFQVQVWQALLRIPAGQVVTYGQLAQALGMPGAARPLGQALGSNPVAFLIPCHRVIRQTGALGGYRWGTARKQAILAWEQAQPMFREREA